MSLRKTHFRLFSKTSGEGVVSGSWSESVAHSWELKYSEQLSSGLVVLSVEKEVFFEDANDELWDLENETFFDDVVDEAKDKFSPDEEPTCGITVGLARSLTARLASAIGGFGRDLVGIESMWLYVSNSCWLVWHLARLDT